MKIVITGTDGFIGGALRTELGESADIFSLNENIFALESWKIYVHDNLNLIRPDAIFHVGACSDTLEKDVNYMMVRNFESTKVLMDWARDNKVPLIYSSSAANYGTNNQHPSNLYGWSKYVGEQYVVANGGVALRYFNVYGPGESLKNKMSSVIWRAICAKLSKEQRPFDLYPLEPKRDFVYVKDVVSANLFALENYEKFRGNFYEVGSGQASQFEEIFSILNYPYRYLDASEIPEGYQFYTCSNPDKWMPDWTPSYNLERGVSEYFEKIMPRW